MKDAYATEDEENCFLLRRDDDKEKRLKVSSEKEKEKTKLRERHRRSITTKILTGLRKHGSYNLPARADINDVLRALATEAGWVVEADGTTYRNSQAVSSGPATSSARLPDLYRPVNRSSSVTPASLITPAPSGSSLNSLAGFTCHALPPLNMDAIDSTGGECSTTSSPRHLSTAHVSLLQQSAAAARFIANQEAPAHPQFGNSLPLGGFSGRYVLDNEPDIFTLRAGDHGGAAAAHDAYLPTDIVEPRELFTPLELSTPSFSALPFEGDPTQSSFYPIQYSGPLEYKPRSSLPSVLLYARQYPPFLQESRASNQNTPIGSPQHHGGSF